MRRLRRDRLTLIAMAIIVFLVGISLLAPIIGEQILKVDYGRTNVDQAFLPPGSAGHVLGTDDLGRDHLARLLYAGQVSLGIAFFAALLSIGIGVTLGMVTGYYGGIVDDLANWLIATLGSIPTLFLLLIIAAVFNPGPFTLIVVLGFLGWLNIARLVRGETLSIRAREYVLSARSIGASNLRIMLSHIGPNLVSTVVITLALDIGSLILTESALSFLGLGIQPPTPSWGNMLSNAQTFFTLGPHLVIMPGVLISLTVLCLFIIGDGVRDAFDPTMRN
jgi:peptide/nickel transport system permease protein